MEREKGLILFSRLSFSIILIVMKIIQLQVQMVLSLKHQVLVVVGRALGQTT